MIADKFLDAPFVKGGRDFDGMDCWGLVYLYYKEIGVDIPSYDYYAIGQNTRDTIRKIYSEKDKHWSRVDKPQLHDVVFCRHGQLGSHVGVYIGEGQMLHIEIGHEACIETITGLKWEHKILGFYRLSALM